MTQSIKLLIQRLHLGIIEPYTIDEDKKITGINSFVKSYLVHRKNLLLLALVVRVFDLIINLAAFSFTIEEVVYLSAESSRKFVIMVILIESLILVYNIITLVLNYKIYQTWHQFKLSLYYSKILAAIILLVPISIAAIPIYNEVKLHHESGEENIHEDYAFDVTIIQIIASVIPVITNAQNFISSSNGLIDKLKNSYEMRFIRSISMIIYIPIYLTAIIVLFNITLNYLILIIGIVYTLYIVIPLLYGNDYEKKIMGWIFAVIAIILVIVFAVQFIESDISAFIIISILSAIIGSYINYLLVSIIMIDLICYFGITYKKECLDLNNSIDVIINEYVAEADDNGYKSLESTI